MNYYVAIPCVELLLMPCLLYYLVPLNERNIILTWTVVSVAVLCFQGVTYTVCSAILRGRIGTGPLPNLTTPAARECACAPLRPISERPVN